MGVIRVNNQPELIKVEEVNYADYVFDDTDDEQPQAHDNTNEQAVERQQHTRRASRRQRIKSGRYRNIVELDDEQSAKNYAFKKRMGGRNKQQRFENERLLIALADPEDICTDLSDMLPDTITAFSKLFLDQGNMKAWTDFADKSEDEQRRFLDSEEGQFSSHAGPSCSDGGHVLGGRDYRGSTPGINGGNGRSRNNQSYAAKTCYGRIDGRIRAVLNQRRLPVDILAKLEQDMSEYFLSCPDGVYVRLLERSYERLLLHALAQYMSLKSRSYSVDETNVRETQVENTKPFFVPPRDTLVNYLAGRRDQKQSRNK